MLNKKEVNYLINDKMICGKKILGNIKSYVHGHNRPMSYQWNYLYKCVHPMKSCYGCKLNVWQCYGSIHLSNK